MSYKIIDRKIAQFALNAGKVNILCHEIGMLILNHAVQHGDCSRAQHLVMAMPASMRRSMLILWFAKYSPIVVKDDANWVAKAHKPMKGDKKTPNPMYVPFDLEGAAANPFYQLAEENPESKILSLEDIIKMIGGLAKRIEKKVDEGHVAAEDANSALAYVTALTGLKVEKVKPDNDAAKADTPKVEAPVVKPEPGNVIAHAMQEAALKAA